MAREAADWLLTPLAEECGSSGRSVQLLFCTCRRECRHVCHVQHRIVCIFSDVSEVPAFPNVCLCVDDSQQLRMDLLLSDLNGNTELSESAFPLWGPRVAMAWKTKRIVKRYLRTLRRQGDKNTALILTRLIYKPFLWLSSPPRCPSQAACTQYTDVSRVKNPPQGAFKSECKNLQTSQWESQMQVLVISTVTEGLTVEGYQTPLKVVSSSYLGLKHHFSSSFLKPHRSTTLTDRQMKTFNVWTENYIWSWGIVICSYYCNPKCAVFSFPYMTSQWLCALPDVISMLCLSSSSLRIFSSSSLCTVSNSSSFSLCKIQTAS